MYECKKVNSNQGFQNENELEDFFYFCVLQKGTNYWNLACRTQLGMQYMRRMRDRNHPLHHLFSTRVYIDYRISLSSNCNITRSEFSKLLQEICNKLLHYYMFYNYNTRHWFDLQLKRHVRLHSSDRKMYECPREGCSRVYTKVS